MFAWWTFWYVLFWYHIIWGDLQIKHFNKTTNVFHFESMVICKILWLALMSQVIKYNKLQTHKKGLIGFIYPWYTFTGFIIHNTLMILETLLVISPSDLSFLSIWKWYHTPKLYYLVPDMPVPMEYTSTSFLFYIVSWKCGWSSFSNIMP